MVRPAPARALVPQTSMAILPRLTIGAFLATSVAVTGCGAGTAESSDRPQVEDTGTRLLVQVHPNGRAKKPTERSLIDCDGTHRGTVTCQRLARVPRKAFKSVPRRRVCTQIYGGPAVAIVRGELRGRRIATSFSRKNGCEISRWDRLDWLLGDAPGAAGP